MTVLVEAAGAAYTEVPVVFSCQGDRLVGIIAMPSTAADVGVVVVVGGPQYRVGSHRQFVHLARRLATRGYVSLRFDCRGMGDSAGEPRTFLMIDDDIRAAVDALFERAPALRRVILWGLCDGASAAMFYAASDPRISGAVLLNPWVRTEQGEAQALITHYYRRKLLDPHTWTRALRGRLNVVRSLKSLGGNLRAGLRGSPRLPAPRGPAPGAPANLRALPLPDATAAALERFTGALLFILSENDLTAAEFRRCAHQSAAWRTIIARPFTQWLDLAESDHTFSSEGWRSQVADATVAFLAAQVRDVASG